MTSPRYLCRIWPEVFRLSQYGQWQSWMLARIQKFVLGQVHNVWQLWYVLWSDVLLWKKQVEEGSFEYSNPLGCEGQMMLSYWVRCVQQLLYPALPEVRESSENSQKVMHAPKTWPNVEAICPIWPSETVNPQCHAFWIVAAFWFGLVTTWIVLVS